MLWDIHSLNNKWFRNIKGKEIRIFSVAYAIRINHSLIISFQSLRMSYFLRKKNGLCYLRELQVFRTLACSFSEY